MRMAVLAALGALLAAPAAQAGVTKETHRVPVRAPDERGQPVTLDVDVYVPDGRPPRRGFPFVEVFHGGGSEKANGYDAGAARAFAERGYVSLIYSQRGHGSSDGQTAVAGPKEMRDVFDVTQWALRRYPIDRARLGLAGYSQGGLHTNLAQVWAADPDINPHGIRFRALAPGNTPSYVFEALVPNRVLKLSFGAGLLGTYLGGAQGRVAPVVEKWIGTAAVDETRLYGGELCESQVTDTPLSTMKQDLAVRSVGCHARRMTKPFIWAQAFDDALFPVEMAIDLWRRSPAKDKRLYLDAAGHAAPAAQKGQEDDELRARLAFMDRWVKGRGRYRAPRVVYWTRDGAVPVPAGSYRYADGSWIRRTADSWPPKGTRRATFRLGSGSASLAPLSEDARNDPVAASALSGTPVGTAPLRALPPTGMPGFAHAFTTEPFAADRELNGAPRVRLRWTPGSPDTQLVLKVFDVAPDGSQQLVTRGVTGVRGAQPGVPMTVEVEANTFSQLVRAGHRLMAWVMAGDAGFYKPYPGSAGGSLDLGASELSLPLRDPAPRRRRR